MVWAGRANILETSWENLIIFRKISYLRTIFDYIWETISLYLLIKDLTTTTGKNFQRYCIITIKELITWHHYFPLEISALLNIFL